MLKVCRSLAFACVFILVAVTHSAAQRPATTTAKSGQPVLIIINTVKADKRQQCEDCMTKFLAAVNKLATTDQRVNEMNAQTRTLHPARPNEDGTWTYVFLADPVVPDTSVYDMSALLKKAYPAAEPERLLKQFADAVVKQDPPIELVQSKL